MEFWKSMKEINVSSIKLFFTHVQTYKNQSIEWQSISPNWLLYDMAISNKKISLPLALEIS